MEIEEGEFYRTKKGEIRKVEDLDDYSFLIDKFYFQIVKYSKNIIDLIEVGDYVNGYRVEQVSIETNEVLLDHNGFGWRTLKDGDKIVTHEQFESIEYKVEENK